MYTKTFVIIQHLNQLLQNNKDCYSIQKLSKLYSIHINGRIYIVTWFPHNGASQYASQGALVSVCNDWYCCCGLTSIVSALC